MKKYVMAGLGVMFLGVVSAVHAEMELKVKDNTANNGFSIKEETTGSTIARFSGDGNVGIGTTNPDNKIHIKQNDSGTTSILNLEQAGTGDSKLKYQLNSFGAWYTGIDNSDGDKFKIGTSETFDADVFMTIVHPSGNVGIGTTAPSNKLHVQGNNTNWLANIEQQGSGSGLLVKTASTSHVAFDIETGGIDRFTVLATGNIGIANTSPSYKLDVNGTIRGDNVSPSDMRWKEHVKTLDNSLRKVSNLRGVSFEWKDKTKGAGTQVGLIAQEVEAVIPEVVSEDNEGYKSVAYDKLVGVLVEAIKEQQRQMEELKKSNEFLRQEIDSIKTFMSTYAQPVTVPASAQIR